MTCQINFLLLAVKYKIYQQIHLWIVSTQPKTFILLYLTILLCISSLIMMGDNMAPIGLHISSSTFFGFYHQFIIYYDLRLFAGNAQNANAIKVVVKRDKNWYYCNWLVVGVSKVMRIVKISKLVIAYKWVIVIIWFRLLRVVEYFYEVVDIIETTYSNEEFWRYKNPSIAGMSKSSLPNFHFFVLAN